MSVLVKLSMVPFMTIGTSKVPIPAGVPVVAQFNPESFSVSRSIEYVENEEAATDLNEGKFKKLNPRSFSFDLLYDGTGASSIKVPVKAAIKAFESTSIIQGPIHRPVFYMVSWGSFLMRCVLKSYSVNYKMMSPEGFPLRAVISTEWEEIITDDLGGKILNLLSPDVTHRHQVTGDEHLPLVCYRTYNDESLYYQVAETNNLDSLRKLNNGDKINLYPIQ